MPTVVRNGLTLQSQISPSILTLPRLPRVTFKQRGLVGLADISGLDSDRRPTQNSLWEEMDSNLVFHQSLLASMNSSHNARFV